MLPGVSARPRWLVCEDGTEYTTRFTRFLGDEFEFTRVGDAAALLGASGGAAGVVLDLDFRRTAPGLLVDEHGATHPALAPGEHQRLAETQGILILRALRAAGCGVPVLLCADLDDPSQVAFLERTYAPLSVIPSTEGLAALACRLRRTPHRG
jgi:hypothetical protein